MARRKADTDEHPHSETALREMVLRRLAHAPRTRAELSRGLLGRGADPIAVDSVLDALADEGLIDDSAFAGLWVESRHRGRGLSRSALKRELHQRGVDPDVVSAAVDVIDDECERQRAVELARRRARVTAQGDAHARRRRLMGYLVRRGYSPALASSVVSTVLEDGETAGHL